MVERDRFSVKWWPDGGVLFDRRTGDTHALDPIAYAVFAAMLDGLSDREQLVSRVASVSSGESTLEDARQLAAVLEQFARLGLMIADVN